MNFGNLHRMASSVIPQQKMKWSRFKSRIQDDRGRWVNTYGFPFTITGSLQPVDMKTVKELGLDISKRYKTLHTSAPIRATEAEAAPDRVSHGGRMYEVMGLPGDWHNVDGWGSVYLVDVGEDRIFQP